MSTVGLVLIVLLVLVLFGGLPTWGYHSYGMYPSSIVGVIIIILIILLVTGRL
jgi:Protein of unknown function (DUF3309)